ncbi:YolD-like family protein [Paenibacillus lutimineralis]|uniref:YolD-like family protein n=1 Tax=Paenibacillus lutimineralis TaxID=2707005 RepID=A0A3Q9IA01_9BACL|nr:YolD-like family protein [Paenibacillus lutimineralis]AZS15995.1 YolD-like family protein [Paenibacillus lutimineralis]
MAGLLEDGGIWERSFILPEHKEAMKRQSREATRKTRPILDGQELEQIQQVLSVSFHEHRRITLRLFDEYDNVEISGIVTAIQTYRREIKLSTAQNDWQWIWMSDILSAE